MDIAKGVERAVKFLVKVYLCLLALCIAVNLIGCWIASVHLSAWDAVRLLGALMLSSVIAYLVWRYRHPRIIRKTGRQGAERTPLMPRSGGEA